MPRGALSGRAAAPAARARFAGAGRPTGRRRLGRGRRWRRSNDGRRTSAAGRVTARGHAHRLERRHRFRDRSATKGRCVQRRLRGRRGDGPSRSGAGSLEVAPAGRTTPLHHERSIGPVVASETPPELRADQRVVRLRLRRLLAAADARLTVAHLPRQVSHGNPRPAKSGATRDADAGARRTPPCGRSPRRCRHRPPRRLAAGRGWRPRARPRWCRALRHPSDAA